MFKGVDGDNEACGVFEALMSYIDDCNNWNLQSKYLRYTQLIKFLDFIELKYCKLNQEVKILIDLQSKRRRRAANKEYQAVLQNKTLFTMNDLRSFLPKDNFFTLISDIETAINAKGYKYVLGGLALYIMLTNGCRNGELANLLVTEVRESRFLEDKDKYVVRVAKHKTSEVYGDKILSMKAPVFRAVQALAAWQEARHRPNVFARQYSGLPNTAYIAEIIHSYGDYNNIPKALCSNNIRFSVTNHIVYHGNQVAVKQLQSYHMHSAKTQGMSYAGHQADAVAVDNQQMVLDLLESADGTF